MFDLSISEMLVIAIVAIVVIGPKELPATLATLGRWTGHLRAIARNFRSGFDAMVREAELQELEKQWAQKNAQIMAEHPAEDYAMEAPPGHESQPAVPAAPLSEVGSDAQHGLPLDIAPREEKNAP